MLDAELAAAIEADPDAALLAARQRAGLYHAELASALGYEREGPWAEFHYEMMEEASRDDVETHLILVPRGHLKTSLVSVVSPCRWLRHDPNERILLGSETQTLANGILAEIKSHFEVHPLLRDLVSDKPGHWVSDSITVKRTSVSRTPSIRSVGIGAKTTGEHFTKGVLDDLVSKDNVTTKDQIDKLRAHYKYILPLMEPGSTLIVIGTRYHFADLYGDLLGENEEHKDLSKGVTVYIRAAIEDEAGQPVPYGKALEGEGNPIWPAKYPKEELIGEKGRMRKMGSYIGSCQYQNQPTDPTASIFKRHQIQWADRNADLPRMVARITTTDWAASERTQSDRSVILTVDIDWVGRKWIRELSVHRWGLHETDEAVDCLLRHVARWKPDLVGIQKATLDKTIGVAIRRRAAEIGKSVPLWETDSTETNKFQRIVGVQPDMEALRWFWCAGCLDGISPSDLEDEITRYPLSPHDDILDAMADVDRVYEVIPTEEPPSSFEEVVLARKQQEGVDYDPMDAPWQNR